MNYVAEFMTAMGYEKEERAFSSSTCLPGPAVLGGTRHPHEGTAVCHKVSEATTQNVAPLLEACFTHGNFNTLTCKGANAKFE